MLASGLGHLRLLWDDDDDDADDDENDTVAKEGQDWQARLGHFGASFGTGV